MSEDAPVNTGAVEWPGFARSYLSVRKMQTNLHRWATGDPGRRFDDLYNLVYDPAFLVAGSPLPRRLPWPGCEGSTSTGPLISSGYAAANTRLVNPP